MEIRRESGGRLAHDLAREEHRDGGKTHCESCGLCCQLPVPPWSPPARSGLK